MGLVRDHVNDWVSTKLTCSALVKKERLSQRLFIKFLLKSLAFVILV